jgi:hypothetical protein
MSAILDLLYREYCRARLAEMRQQLLLSVPNDEISATDWAASDPAGPEDRGRRLGDDNATKTPQPSARRVLQLHRLGWRVARYLHTS